MQKQIHDDESIRLQQLEAFKNREHLSTERWIPDQPVKGPDYKLNDVSEIPIGRMNEMKAHFEKLKKKFPHMKDARIAKKVAKEFKVRLV